MTQLAARYMKVNGDLYKAPFVWDPYATITYGHTTQSVGSFKIANVQRYGYPDVFPPSPYTTRGTFIMSIGASEHGACNYFVDADRVGAKLKVNTHVGNYSASSVPISPYWLHSWKNDVTGVESESRPITNGLEGGTEWGAVTQCSSSSDDCRFAFKLKQDSVNLYVGANALVHLRIPVSGAYEFEDIGRSPLRDFRFGFLLTDGLLGNSGTVDGTATVSNGESRVIYQYDSDGYRNYFVYNSGYNMHTFTKTSVYNYGVAYFPAITMNTDWVTAGWQIYVRSMSMQVS